MAAAPGLKPERLLLRPFAAAPAPTQLRLQAELRRQGSILQIRWILSGHLETLRLPKPVDPPRRRDELWTSTCLECFLARPLEAGYWELNLSPCGDWNLYRLDGYRQGLRPEASIHDLPSQRRFSVIGDVDSAAGSVDDSDASSDASSDADSNAGSAGGTYGADQPLEQSLDRSQKQTSGQTLELSVELELEALLGAEAATAALELGVTAVLERQDGQLSYWAFCHPASEPDFHDRAGFGVRLPASGCLG
ncbi:MAG: DOMON-like domain-containing protein [Synechococcaceae cyanobacterium]